MSRRSKRRGMEVDGFQVMLAARNRSHDRSSQHSRTSLEDCLPTDHDGKPVSARSVNCRIRQKAARRNSPSHFIPSGSGEGIFRTVGTITEYRIKNGKVTKRIVRHLSSNYHIDPCSDRGTGSISTHDESGLRGSREKRFIKKG